MKIENESNIIHLLAAEVEGQPYAEGGYMWVTARTYWRCTRGTVDVEVTINTVPDIDDTVTYRIEYQVDWYRGETRMRWYWEDGGARSCWWDTEEINGVLDSMEGHVPGLIDMVNETEWATEYLPIHVREAV